MANAILQLPNAFNVGTDVSASISNPQTGSNRNLDEFGQLEEFRARSLTTKIEVTPISRGGVRLFRTLYGGAEIDIKWAKVFSALQYFWNALQNNYFQLHQFTSFVIAASCINRDGTVDEFQFTGCEADGEDLGDFMGTKAVNNELKFRCQTFQMVSANAPDTGADPLSFQ
jgi:hypothetical protein